MNNFRTFISEAVFSTRLIEDYKGDITEYIKRELAIKIVKELPMADLEKIILFEKITGYDQINPFDSSDRRYKIQEMRNKRQETHIAKIKIPYEI